MARAFADTTNQFLKETRQKRETALALHFPVSAGSIDERNKFRRLCRQGDCAKQNAKQNETKHDSAATAVFRRFEARGNSWSVCVGSREIEREFGRQNALHCKRHTANDDAAFRSKKSRASLSFSRFFRQRSATTLQSQTRESS